MKNILFLLAFCSLIRIFADANEKTEGEIQTIQGMAASAS